MAGVAGGPSIPRLSGGNNEVSQGYESRLAPNFGVVGEYTFTEHLSLLAEVDFSGQGGVRKGMQPITQSPAGLPPLPEGQYLYGDFKNESILNYLEIPVMIKYRRNFAEQWNWFAEAGPFVGFLLEAKEKTSGTSEIYVDKDGTMPLAVEGQPLPPQSFDQTTDVKSDLHKFNWGVTGGVGISYLATKNSQIILDARGEYGLREVQRNTERDGSSHTGNAVFSIGYLYNFGL